MGNSCTRIDESWCGGCRWRCRCYCCEDDGIRSTCPARYEGYSNKLYRGDIFCSCNSLGIFIAWVVAVALVTVFILYLCYAWSTGKWCFRRRPQPPAVPYPAYPPPYPQPVYPYPATGYPVNPPPAAAPKNSGTSSED